MSSLEETSRGSRTEPARRAPRIAAEMLRGKRGMCAVVRRTDERAGSW